jgi:GxxExxY protein
VEEMPIKPGIQTQPISCDDFHALDYDVMGIVFSIHRDLGRFWNEKIYQNELAYRCQKAGFEKVFTEIPIQVSYENFTKTYKIDLLINNGIYELKTAQALTGEHEKQTINYLMLTGLNHAKLINMRPPSVQHRFVSTNMTPEKRYDFTIDDEHWRELDEDSIWLKRIFKSLLNEWGVFLEINLFYDAIVHFLGGEEKVVKELEAKDGPRFMGKQKAHMLNSNVAFKISAVTKDERSNENHLRRFIRYTSLKAVQWINFDHHRVVFKTILK